MEFLVYKNKEKMKPGFQTFEMGTHFATIFKFHIGLVICCMLITYYVIQVGWNIA